MPQLMCYQLATLSIATLFYVWRDLLKHRIRDSKILRERVAYMLWVAASR